MQDATKTDVRRIKTKNEIVTAMCAGAVAGAVAKTTIAPLDRTKIHFQVDRKDPFSYLQAWKFLRTTVQTEGFLALWRGNSATMARVVPYAAIQFTSHEQWKKLLAVDRPGEEATPLKRFASGSLAGATGTICTYPLDFARARLAITRKEEYRSLWAVFTYVRGKYGLAGLYRGIQPTLLGSLLYAGCSFYTFETLKLERRARRPDAPISAWEKFVFGAMAGVASQSCSYPLDIVRRRMQTGKAVAGLGIAGHLVHIGRTEGLIKGLYKGLSMNWIKGPIAVGISFTVFDTCLHTLRVLPAFGHS